MKKVLFIINPTAGKERMKRHLMSVLDLFTKADWDVTVHITQAALDATNVAQKQGADFDMIVCSGGDGTLSETISGMILERSVTQSSLIARADKIFTRV